MDIIGVVAVVTLMQGASSGDLAQVLKEHLRSLEPISATCTRSRDLIAEDNQSVVKEWARIHYQGARLDWSRGSGSIHTIDYYPDGEPAVAALFRAGRTTTYDYSDHAAAEGELYQWWSDLYPDAYFLDLPPIPFRHFLVSAIRSTPSGEETEAGVSDILILTNPALPNEQSLRVAVCREPVRILSIDWMYTAATGEELTAERFEYDDWIQFNGQEFPLTHRKHIYHRGSLRDSMSLALTDVRQAPPPTDLLVEPGTTYRRAQSGTQAILVGSIPPDALVDIATELLEWVSLNPGARVFVAPTVDLEGSLCRLEEYGSLPTEPVPLNSETINRECGPVCLSLAMALQQGVESDYEEMRRALGPISDGVSVADIERTCRGIGLETAALETDIHKVLSHDRPAILPVRVGHSQALPSHFILIVGEYNGDPIVMNPPNPAFVASEEWLKSHWDGSALIISSAPIVDSRLWGSRLAYFLAVCGVAFVAVRRFRVRRMGTV